MQKTLIITIIVDGVELEELDTIQTTIDSMLEFYENKRVTMQLQDEPMVTRR